MSEKSCQTCKDEQAIFCNNCPRVSTNITFAKRIDFNIVTNITSDIINEFNRATSKHPKFNSRHEVYAILLEELNELWEEIKKNHTKSPEAKIAQRKEAVQVAAMAMRFIYDCCEEPNPEEQW
jgi:ATP sulfurylase